MGQRLNLEIHKEGEVVANSYYHWSGYTSSSIELTKIVLDHVNKIKEENDVVLAVRLLEATGAGLTVEELPFAKKEAPDHDFKMATSRNDGLIAVSENGIDETRRWEEARVTVDLSEKTVNFNAFWYYSKDDFIKNYGEKDYNECPEQAFDYPLDAIPFDRFDDFATVILELIKNRVYAVKDQNGNVLSFIE